MRPSPLIFLLLLLSVQIQVSYQGSTESVSSTIPPENPQVDAYQVTLDGVISVDEYYGSMVVGSSGITLYYMLDSGNVYLAYSGAYTGWMSIGFGYTNKMSDSDILIGYVDSTAHMQDNFGTGTVAHKADTAIGGTEDILGYAGSESAGTTILEFYRKLNTGDATADMVLPLDSSIPVIWGYSSTDDFTSIHSARGYGSVTFDTYAPSEPKSLVTTPGDNQVSLSWQQPNTDGGLGIDNYNIYRSETSSSGYTLVGTSGTTEFTDTTVTNGIRYYYVISAVNSKGESGFSNEGGPVLPSGSITEPLNLAVTTGDGNVNLTWDPPATSGGTPVIAYLVYRSKTDGGPYTFTGNTTVTNYNDSIDNGYTYYYVVTALNAVAESPYSSQISASPVGRSTPPLNLAGVANDNNVSLNWNAPLSDGGFTISTYNIYRSLTPAGGYVLIDTTTSLSYTDTTVVNLETYFYVVSANNSAGESGYSNEVRIKVAKVPYAIEEIDISASYFLVSLNWTTPFDNGYNITHYNIYRSTKSSGPFVKVGTSTNTSFDDVTVSNGIEYYFQVTAENSQGEGPATITVSAIPGDHPSVVRNIASIVGNNQVFISWEEPLYSGGSEITNYNLYKRNSSELQFNKIYSGLNLNYTDINVINGETYRFKISAENNHGEGILSDEILVKPGTVPESPINVTTRISGEIVVIDWIEPEGNGYPIIQYNVYRSLEEDKFTFLGFTKSLTFIDEFAFPGLNYSYAISAINEFGESDLSNESTIMIPIEPSVPYNVLGIAGDHIIGLTWNQPLLGDEFITHYHIYRAIGDSNFFALVGNVTVTEFTTQAVENGIKYRWYVTGVSKFGETAPSEIVVLTPEASKEPVLGNSDQTTSFFLRNMQGLLTMSLFLSVGFVGMTIFFVKRMNRGIRHLMEIRGMEDRISSI